MKEVKNRIVVSYNESQANVNLKTLQDHANRYNTYIDAVASVTGSTDFKTIEQIEQHIKDATSFSNVEKSAVFHHLYGVVQHAVAEAPFVVIPGHNFDQTAINAGFSSIKNG